MLACLAGAAPPPTPAELVARMGSTDIAVRAESAQRLRKAGAAAVPALIEGLKHPDAYVRMRSADILGALGPEAKEAVGALTASLKDRNSMVQKRAARALDSVSPPEKVPASLVRATLRAQGQTRTLPGDAVPALLAALSDESESMRLGAVKALAEIRPPDQRALAPLIRVLENDRAELRFYAARTLEAMGPEADRASGALAAALRDPEQQVRAQAARTLEAVGPAAAPRARQALVMALSDEDWLVRALAARALASVDPIAGADAVARMKNALLADVSHEDEGVRYYAVAGLGAMGPAAGGSAPALIKALEDPKASVRRAAADALLQSGTGNLPALVRVWRASSDEPLRARIGEALVEAGEASVPSLVETLRSGSRRLCIDALELIARLGPKAAGAAPVLGRLLDPEGQRAFAFYKERALDPAVPLAVSHRSLSIRNDDIRFRALHALGTMGPAAAPAASSVRALAKDPNRTIRHKAEAVFAVIAPEAPRTAPRTPARATRPRPARSYRGRSPPARRPTK